MIPDDIQDDEQDTDAIQQDIFMLNAYMLTVD